METVIHMAPASLQNSSFAHLEGAEMLSADKTVNANPAINKHILCNTVIYQ